MSEYPNVVNLTAQQWARILELMPKLKAKKIKADKAKTKDLEKMSKAELIDLIKSLAE